MSYFVSYSLIDIGVLLLPYSTFFKSSCVHFFCVFMYDFFGLIICLLGK